MGTLVSRMGRSTSPGRAGASSPSVDRKSTRLNSSHQIISYAVFCLKKKKFPESLQSDPNRQWTAGGWYWPSQNGFVFFFNDTATTEIYTLSLHDALPISGPPAIKGCASIPAEPSCVLAWARWFRGWGGRLRRGARGLRVRP